MKRLLSAVLAGMLAFSLAACGANQPPSSAVPSEAPSDSVSAAPSASQTENGQTSGSNILIVYFTADENREVDAVTSASLTTVGGVEKGRVRAVADMIQAETGGDLFSIQTDAGYPSNGSELIDYAAEEQRQNVRPTLATHIENLADYDTVFVGFPNWWYDMPMALYSFFDEYDLSGKTIIPFNVHNGSRFSGTIQTIQELEPGANVITDGFTVSERTVADAAADVGEWLRGLGF